MAKLGIMIEAQEGLTWERWTNLIDATESLGFDSLWRSDHLWSTIGGHDREALALWPALTLVAARTRRIEFGQLVSPITWRNPVLMARNAAALDRLSDGRFNLGLGAGWNTSEHEAFGIPFPSARERLNMLDEAIQVIRLLNSGEEVSFDGEYYQLHHAVCRPTPTRPGGVPIVIGGKNGKRILQIIATYADEWNVNGLTPREFQDRQQTVDRVCAEVGRNPRAIRRSLMIAHLLGRTEEDLLQRARRMQRILPSLADIPVEAVPDRLRERGWLVGTPEDAIARIMEWQAAGIERFMLQTLDQEDISALELIASDVLPKVTAAAEKDTTGPGHDA